VAGRGGAERVEAFCRAVWRHDDATIAALAGRVDPNGADRWGHTPLLMAATYGDRALVARLVERGAEVDQGRTHLTPLTLAARRREADIVDLLRGRGARLSIVTAIYLGDRDRVARDLEGDPALAQLRDEEGTPILHHAAMALAPEMVALLLDRGAAIDEAAPDGETALHRVADLRRAPQPAAGAMAAFLLDRGATIDAKNRFDVTPLHDAVRARNLAVVEVLLGRGADANARDKRGSTPLRRAVSATGAGDTAGTSELMAPLTRILLAHGADPDARDRRGVPVHASARAADVKAVLAEHRASASTPASPRSARRSPAPRRSPRSRPKRAPRRRGRRRRSPSRGRRARGDQ